MNFISESPLHDIELNYFFSFCTKTFPAGTSAIQVGQTPEETPIYSVSGNYQISNCFEYSVFPLHFSKIEEDLHIHNCHVSTLKNLVNEIGGRIVVEKCNGLDEREVEFINDVRLRKLWNRSKLNLEDFLKENRSAFVSRKFGF